MCIRDRQITRDHVRSLGPIGGGSDHCDRLDPLVDPYKFLGGKMSHAVHRLASLTSSTTARTFRSPMSFPRGSGPGTGSHRSPIRQRVRQGGRCAAPLRLLLSPRRDDRFARRAATGSKASTRSQTWRSRRQPRATEMPWVVLRHKCGYFGQAGAGECSHRAASDIVGVWALIGCLPPWRVLRRALANWSSVAEWPLWRARTRAVCTMESGCEVDLLAARDGGLRPARDSRVHGVA